MIRVLEVICEWLDDNAVDGCAVREVAMAFAVVGSRILFVLWLFDFSVAVVRVVLRNCILYYQCLYSGYRPFSKI